jgi:putative membrane protein
MTAPISFTKRKKTMKNYFAPLLITAVFTVSACETGYGENALKNTTDAPKSKVVQAQSPGDLNDLEIAHVAYTADNIDIRYANIALKRSTNPDIHAFAETMIRDHTAVNKLALGLLDKLGASAQDNFLSQTLNTNSVTIVTKLESLSGKEFDQYYAVNELTYHKAVNDLVENSFIPNIENAEVKELFEAGLGIFKGHEGHARMMVENLSE